MKDQAIDPLPTERFHLEGLSDAEVVQEVSRRATRERQATAGLIRALMEFDRRQLYLPEGYPSLYAYCTGALHYSEHGAFNRIEVARAAARWPQLLACLEDGSLHLAGARLLAPHLTEENIEMALESARHKSKRDIEEIAAVLAQRSLLVPSGADRYRLHLTISRAARDTLRQVQALMAHRVPDADPSLIFEQALTLLLHKLQRQRFAATDRPRMTVTGSSRAAGAAGESAGDAASALAEHREPQSRHLPNSVKRAVWTRDEGRCAFVGAQGRCTERSRLEFHHLVPFAAGGRATASNIELRCRPHNAYEAERYFGGEFVAAAREARRRRLSPPEGSSGATGISARPGASRTKPESGGQPDLELHPSEGGGARGIRSRPGASSTEPPADAEPRGVCPDRFGPCRDVGIGKSLMAASVRNRGMAWIPRLASALWTPHRV